MVPRVVFYAVGNVLVIISLVDAVYVARLFQLGNLKKIWPVRVLSVLVSGD